MRQMTLTLKLVWNLPGKQVSSKTARDAEKKVRLFIDHLSEQKCLLLVTCEWPFLELVISRCRRSQRVVKRSRAAYRGVPFSGPFTRFVRGPLLHDGTKSVFSRQRALLPRVSISGRDERRARARPFLPSADSRAPLFPLRVPPPPSCLPVPFVQPTHYNSGTFRGMNTYGVVCVYWTPAPAVHYNEKAPRADAFFFK